MKLTFTVEVTGEMLKDAVEHALKGCRKDWRFCPQDGELLESERATLDSFAEAVLRAISSRDISEAVDIESWLADIAMELVDEHSRFSGELSREWHRRYEWGNRVD